MHVVKRLWIQWDFNFLGKSSWTKGFLGIVDENAVIISRIVDSDGWLPKLNVSVRWICYK